MLFARVCTARVGSTRLQKQLVSFCQMLWNKSFKNEHPDPKKPAGAAPAIDVHMDKFSGDPWPPSNEFCLPTGRKQLGIRKHKLWARSLSDLRFVRLTQSESWLDGVVGKLRFSVDDRKVSQKIECVWPQIYLNSVIPPFALWPKRSSDAGMILSCLWQIPKDETPNWSYTQCFLVIFVLFIT